MPLRSPVIAARNVASFIPSIRTAYTVPDPPTWPGKIPSYWLPLFPTIAR
jgi:hypothetical protein